MKILFLGDYSGLHATYASRLRSLGHQVTLVSDGGGHMLTSADVLIPREPGLAGKIKYMYRLLSLLPEWRGYDVVQLINPGFLKLKPGRLAYFFRQLKKQNGQISLTLAGNDHHFVKACLEPGFFRYSQFKVGSEKTQFSVDHRLEVESWVHPILEKYTNLVYEQCDTLVSTLYEYDVAARRACPDKVHYAGLPINCTALRETPMEFPDGKVNLFVGMVKGREVEKGTDRLLEMARELEAELPEKCRVTRVSNVSFEEYIRLQRQSHIVLDQLYSYSPALNALDAMALGRVAASGAQPEFYGFIGEEELKPVVSLSPVEEDMKGELRKLILDRDLLLLRGKQSREFVMRHNEVGKVTDRLLEIWERR